MSQQDASWHEMPGFTFPGWPGRDPAEQLLDTILAGRPLPPDAPRGLQVVTEQLVGLASPGTGRLPGEAAAVAAFCRAVSSGGPSQRRGTLIRTQSLAVPRRRGLLAIGRARLAAALAVAGLVMGTTAAAYAGALPASMQALAHKIIDAPAARHAPGHAPARRHHRTGGLPPSQHAQGQHYGHSQPHGKAEGHVKHQHPWPPPKPGRHGHHPKPSS